MDKRIQRPSRARRAEARSRDLAREKQKQSVNRRGPFGEVSGSPRMAYCLMSNCRKVAPAGEAMCAGHR